MGMKHSELVRRLELLLRVNVLTNSEKDTVALAIKALREIRD